MYFEYYFNTLGDGFNDEIGLRLCRGDFLLLVASEHFFNDFTLLKFHSHVGITYLWNLKFSKIDESVMFSDLILYVTSFHTARKWYFILRLFRLEETQKRISTKIFSV